ncbi:MAG: GIY-YIG nuclease family protein [Sedimentisphaerales bacterium]|jgi:hypothetical protein
MDKKHIINEIIRTANENKGVPLGRKKFERLTGIKESDWCGIYWAKWGDGIREAGYNPNKMCSAYNEKFLVECVVALIREIKRFPTGADFRLKAHNTKGFPWRFDRLGKKPEMAQKILNYCKVNHGYEDVIEICEGVLASSENKEREVDSEETEPQFGYVYLMKSGRYYKIGRSDCVEKRNYEIGIKLPEELKIIHKIKTDDPSGIEAYWHKRFEDKRKSGEWFDLSSGDVKAFGRRKFM